MNIQCPCCAGDKALIWIDSLNSAFVDSSGEMMVTAHDHILRFKVKYCPECGRRFGREYLDLKRGDDIFYVDFENGVVEHGKIVSVAFKESKVDSFSIDFDDGTFDEIDGSGLGKHYFVDKQEAQNVLAEGE